jgi:DNA-binding PadR family transcriptional regulator
MHTEYAILAGILAETDAIWLPIRSWGDRTSANVGIARAAYPARGVAWASGMCSSREGMAALRDLAALEANGLLVVVRDKGRAVSVRLTDAGDELARALVGIPTLAAGVLTVRELARHCDREPRTMDRLWVPETTLADHPWGAGDSGPFRIVEQMALPALVRGWVVSNSDMAGRAYYRLTPAGWALADGDAAAPDVPTVDFDEDVRGVYGQRLRLALDRLASETPRTTMEIGPLPLPVAFQGMPISHELPTGSSQ